MTLEARGLTVHLDTDEAETTVLEGVDLSLAPGEVVDMTGPSGAGKSTLLLALARLLPIEAGELRMDGRSAADVPPREWRRRAALVQQRASIITGSVRDNLLLPYTLKQADGETPPTERELEAALEDAGLGGVAPDRDARRLSVGQAARVALLRTILTRPGYLLLDEPDANLDEESARLIGHLVREAAGDGAGVLQVRHRPAGHEPDRRLVLRAGSLEVGGRA